LQFDEVSCWHHFVPNWFREIQQTSCPPNSPGQAYPATPNTQTVSAMAQVFLTPKYLAIAMEYVSGGDMFEHVVRKGGLRESEAR